MILPTSVSTESERAVDCMCHSTPRVLNIFHPQQQHQIQDVVILPYVLLEFHVSLHFNVYLSLGPSPVSVPKHGYRCVLQRSRTDQPVQLQECHVQQREKQHSGRVRPRTHTGRLHYLRHFPETWRVFDARAFLRIYHQSKGFHSL